MRKQPGAMPMQASQHASSDRAAHSSGAPDPWDEGGDEDSKAFEPLTPEAAAALRARLPGFSPWRVVAVQCAAGALMVVLWGLLGSRHAQWWSALCGAIAVVVPTALMAWGITRRPVAHAGAALASLMSWELIKIVLVAALLLAAIRWVPDLSWTAMLLTMVGCLKVYWLVLFRQGRKKN